MEMGNINENGIPRRRALGKGLEELFNSEVLDYSTVEEKIVNETPKEEITNVKLKDLRSNPYQPRKVKKSIKGYEIIAGERRVKASILAGLDEIPAIIRDFNDTQMMEIALLENLQRENLTAIEEANAYRKLQETLILTQDELAKRLGKSRSHITNTLGLLNLPEDIQNDINEKKISMGHARVLSKLSNITQQKLLERKVIEDGISVRELEKLAQKETIEKNNPQVRKTKENEYSYLEDELSERLGTRVKIKKNKMEINFTNNNDLNRILELLNIEVGR